MARDERLSERRAASAVAGALRPAHRDAIRRETGQKNVAKVIAKAMIENANADRIIALVNGEIVEEGNHDTLMARKGEYYRLYNLQFKDEGNGNDRLAKDVE